MTDPILADLFFCPSCQGVNIVPREESDGYARMYPQYSFVPCRACGSGTLRTQLVRMAESDSYVLEVTQ